MTDRQQVTDQDFNRVKLDLDSLLEISVREKATDSLKDLVARQEMLKDTKMFIHKDLLQVLMEDLDAQLKAADTIVLQLAADLIAQQQV